MKNILIVIATMAILSCTSGMQPHDATQTEASLLVLQTQVQQLQIRFDSLLQSLHPIPKQAAKKTKAKTNPQRVGSYSTENTSSKYKWQTDNSTVTPTFKPKKEVALYRVRTGAICRDGTSSSATGRGACSHHGGVSQWVYE